MKLFCKLPFTRISVDDSGNVWPACCPEWVAFPLGNIFEQSWENIWMGKNARLLRESCFDGSLRYCKHTWCPNITDAKAGIDNYHVIPLEKAPRQWQPAPPVHINLNYDPTCNLRCPSCRADFIKLTPNELNRVYDLHKYTFKYIVPEVESIAFTGVGDPFMSKVFRQFMMEFNPADFPRLKVIHLHTNGLLFDEETYTQMKGLHRIQLSTDISIDAASADVYAIVRPPGKWERLMKNLQFIRKLDNLVLLGISMVVQRANMHQLREFVALGEQLVYGRRETFVEFKRLRHDPHISAEAYRQMNVDDAPPDLLRKFSEDLQYLEQLRQYQNRYRIMPEIRHNLQVYLNTQTNVSPLPLIVRGRLLARKVFNSVTLG
ncbi:MAG: radical SAM protein [Chitinophagales bacterium]|nr:radical SAM protein [Chitinophagales bacterium]MDW8418402.1 radical SAM protein [Chitinophagales bacterium]